MTKDPELKDETPDLPDAPDSSEVNVQEITEESGDGRKKRAIFDNIVDKLESKCFKLMMIKLTTYYTTTPILIKN